MQNYAIQNFIDFDKRCLMEVYWGWKISIMVLYKLVLIWIWYTAKILRESRCFFFIIIFVFVFVFGLI